MKKIEKYDFVKLICKDSSYGWNTAMHNVIGSIGQVKEITGDEYIIEFTERGNVKIFRESERIRNGFMIKGVNYSFISFSLKLIISQNEFQKRIDKIEINTLLKKNHDYVVNAWKISLGETPLDEPLGEIFRKLNKLYTKSIK